LAILALLACIIVMGLYFWLNRRDLPRAVADALEGADQYELLSLYPYLSESEFHNHRILGRTLISDPSLRRSLNGALRRAARESDGRMMCCFNPRHGIRVTRGGRVTDIVICFECLQVHVYAADGQSLGQFLISKSQQPAFDAVLRNAGVPLAANLR
jgi:hypothetical protein